MALTTQAFGENRTVPREERVYIQLKPLNILMFTGES